MPAQLARVTRTLLGWLVELVVMRLPGMAILNELGEAGAEGLVREPEHKVEIATLQWRMLGKVYLVFYTIDKYEYI